MTDDAPDGPEPPAAAPPPTDPQAAEPSAPEAHAGDPHTGDPHAADSHAADSHRQDLPAQGAHAPALPYSTEAEHAEDDGPEQDDEHAQDDEPEIIVKDLWDYCADWLALHGALPALGLLTVAMFLIYGHVFGGELAGDDLTFHMAESARLADCLRAGDFDFWNPSANGGFASAYYYQVVPQLMSAIPAAVFGHHLFFFELSVFLPLVLAPAAAYRGIRLMGATPWKAVVAALAIGFLNGESAATTAAS